MNKKIDLLLGTIGSVLAGILFALCYNAFMGKFMIGYSMPSSIVAGGIFGALIGTPLARLGLNETGKIWTTSIFLGLASLALLASLKLPVNVAATASFAFAAAFGCVAYVMDRITWRFSLGYFLTSGALVGAGLYLANVYLAVNAGFSWQGLVVIGLHGLVCAAGAYLPMLVTDHYRAASLKDLF